MNATTLSSFLLANQAFLWTLTFWGRCSQHKQGMLNDKKSCQYYSDAYSRQYCPSDDYACISYYSLLYSHTPLFLHCIVSWTAPSVALRGYLRETCYAPRQHASLRSVGHVYTKTRSLLLAALTWAMCSQPKQRLENNKRENNPFYMHV